MVGNTHDIGTQYRFKPVQALCSPSDVRRGPNAGTKMCVFLPVWLYTSICYPEVAWIMVTFERQVNAPQLQCWLQASAFNIVFSQIYFSIKATNKLRIIAQFLI